MKEFVPFKISKKLKEKGFKEKCLAYYDVDDNVGLLYNMQYTDYTSPCQYTDLLKSHNTDEAVVSLDDSEYCIDAPTISQVLKWLREEKEIEIVIEPIDTNTVFMGGEKYILSIYINRKRYYKIHHDKIDKYVQWEEAALAGIEYVLNNLIM